MDRHLYLSGDEIKKLLKVAKAIGKEGIRNHEPYKIKAWVMVELLLRGAFRVGEATAIRWENVHIGKNNVMIRLEEGKRTRKGKDGKKHFNPREVYIGKEIIPILQTYRKHCNGNRYLFESERGGKYSVRNLQWWFNGVITKAGLKMKRRGIHSLRHTSISKILHDTGDLIFTMQTAGHSNVGTTSRYLHIALAGEKLANLVRFDD